MIVFYLGIHEPLAYILLACGVDVFCDDDAVICLLSTIRELCTPIVSKQTEIQNVMHNSIKFISMSLGILGQCRILPL